MGLGRPGKFVKATRKGMPPVPLPPTRPKGFKEKLRGLRKKYEAHREGQRERELSRAQEEISHGQVLLKRDKLRAKRAEATGRMVRAGGGTFKERMQYGQGDIFGAFGGPQQSQRRPRKSRPKKKQSRSSRAPPKQKTQFEKLMWG